MNIKAFAAAAAIAFSSSAMAVPTTTTDLGVIDQSTAQFEHSWVRFFGVGASPGPFIDNYLFELVSAADTVGTIFMFSFGSLDLTLDSVTLHPTGDPGSTIAGATPGSFASVALWPEITRS